MTLPHERIRALDSARLFLYTLLDPKQTPRVPREVRRRAGRVLRHYPGGVELDMLSRGDARFFSAPHFRAAQPPE